MIGLKIHDLKITDKLHLKQRQTSYQYGGEFNYSDKDIMGCPDGNNNYACCEQNFQGCHIKDLIY